MISNDKRKKVEQEKSMCKKRESEWQEKIPKAISPFHIEKEKPKLNQNVTFVFLNYKSGSLILTSLSIIIIW